MPETDNNEERADVPLGDMPGTDEATAPPAEEAPGDVAVPDEAPFADPQRQFGMGVFPPELNRFSWGAFFLPFFWGIVYRSWPVMSAWFVATMSPFVIVAAVGAGGDNPTVRSVILAAVISEVVAGVARLWAGMNANRLLWTRDALAIELKVIGGPRMSVERFTSRQRLWGMIGGVLMIGGSIAAIPVYAPMWKQYGMEIAGSAMPVLWLSAETMLAFWLDARMREEPPGVSGRADSAV